jgi:hypothetical protein
MCYGRSTSCVGLPRAMSMAHNRHSQTSHRCRRGTIGLDHDTVAPKAAQDRDGHAARLNIGGHQPGANALVADTRGQSPVRPDYSGCDGPIPTRVQASTSLGRKAALNFIVRSLPQWVVNTQRFSRRSFRPADAVVLVKGCWGVGAGHPVCSPEVWERAHVALARIPLVWLHRHEPPTTRPPSVTRGYGSTTWSSVIMPSPAWKKMWQCIAQRPRAPPAVAKSLLGLSSRRTLYTRLCPGGMSTTSTNSL